jgi:hypothetical protein
MKRLLEYLGQQPELPEDEFPMPVREVWPERFNSHDMFRD